MGKHFFICGSALRGQPDHQNLRSATLIKEVKTQPQYRLHTVGPDLHPGIYEVDLGGISIPGELYDLTMEQYAHLMTHEPPGLYEGSVILEDGEIVSAMLYPRELIEQYQWKDISEFGGWVAYKASQTS